LTECIGLNHHLFEDIAIGALKRADIETHACRHDASEYHVSTALRASRAMEVEIDLVRQEIGLLHDASLFEKAGVVANQNIGQQKYCPEATLPWRDQLALEPFHYLLGLQGITELHRRLELMRATMTFKGPKVIT
jgi:hypothetical protein